MKTIATIIVLIFVVIFNCFGQGSTSQKIEKKAYDLLWSTGKLVKNDLGQNASITFKTDQDSAGIIQEMVSLIGGDTLIMKVITINYKGTQVQSVMDFTYLGVTKYSNSNQVYEFPKILTNGEIAFKCYFEPNHNAFSDDSYYVIISKINGNLGLNQSEGSIRTISLR